MGLGFEMGITIREPFSTELCLSVWKILGFTTLRGNCGIERGDIGMRSVCSASLAISDGWTGQNGRSRRTVHVRNLMISGVL